MASNDKRLAYYTLIGEFIHLCAKIELCITTCALLKENHERDIGDTSLIIRIEKKLTDKFYKKIELLDNVIKNNGNQSTKPSELDDLWSILRAEVMTIINDRQFLVHGTGLYFFFAEPIKACIVEYGKKELTTKEYTLDEIQNLNKRAYTLLYGVNGLEQKFLHLYGYWITGKPVWLTAYRIVDTTN